MSKETTFKHKVDQLTFYAGRQYLPGEVVEFIGEDARIAAEYYGKKPPEPAEEDQTSKVAQNIKSQKAANASAGAE